MYFCGSRRNAVNKINTNRQNATEKISTREKKSVSWRPTWGRKKQILNH